MCQFKILKKSTNGILLFCEYSNMFQLSYKNILLDLSSFELLEFTKYLKKIDCVYWEHEYVNSIYEKKIPIPTVQKNLILMMNVSEIEETLYLLDNFKNSQFLKVDQIDYKLVLN